MDCFMKIAIDLRALLHGKASGISTYVRELTHEMIKNKEHEFVLFLSGRHQEYLDILDRFSRENVKIFFLKTPNRIFNLKQIFLGMPKVDILIKKRLGIQVDVFFMPDMRPLALSRNCKKVCTCHDLSFFKFPQYFSRKSRFWYFLNRPEKYFRSADKVIAVSEFTQRELEETVQVKSEVVYEGARLEGGGEFAAVREKYGLPRRFLLSLSTLEPRKNLERVVKAFSWAKLSGVELVLAGEADREVFAKLDIPKMDKVKFIGFVDEGDKATLYKMSEGFLYVSLYEGFGLPVLEAFKCGVPVLTSEGSSMQEICGEEAIYANPESVGSIAEGIRALTSKKWSPEKLKARASRFSWAKAAEETLLILTHIIPNKDRDGGSNRYGKKDPKDSK